MTANRMADIVQSVVTSPPRAHPFLLPFRLAPLSALCHVFSHAHHSFIPSFTCSCMPMHVCSTHLIGTRPCQIRVDYDCCTCILPPIALPSSPISIPLPPTPNPSLSLRIRVTNSQSHSPRAPHTARPPPLRPRPRPRHPSAFPVSSTQPLCMLSTSRAASRHANRFAGKRRIQSIFSNPRSPSPATSTPPLAHVVPRHAARNRVFAPRTVMYITDLHRPRGLVSTKPLPRQLLQLAAIGKEHVLYRVAE